MKRTRDSQRSRVYAMTWETGGIKNELSLAECDAICRRVCADYRINAPTLTDGRRRRSGVYHVYDNEIALPRFARNKTYLLHEIAHAIARQGPAHGPIFARVYVNLMVRYADADKKELLARCKKHRVKLAVNTKVPQATAPRKASRIRKIEERMRVLQTELNALDVERNTLLGRQTMNNYVPAKLRELLSI